MLPTACRCFYSFLLCVVLVPGLLAQVAAPTTGEVTVQLIQGLNSAANPRGITQGRVTKSTNPSVLVGSAALVGLRSDPSNGGYTVVLLELGLHGATMRAGSSAVALAPDVFNKALELTRKPGVPKNSVSGTTVFLPEKTSVRFTLAEPPPQQPVPGQGDLARSASRTAASSDPPLPKAWAVRPIQRDNGAGKQAIFYGTIQSAGKEQRVGLGVSCVTGVYTGGKHQPFALTSFELYFRPAMINFSTGYMGEKEAFNDAAGTSQLGSAAPMRVDLGDGSTQNGRLTVQIGYEEPDLKDIVASPGAALHVTVGPDPEEKPATASPIAVMIALPADNAPLQAVMAPCFTPQEAEAAAKLSREVVSCPLVDGKVVRDIAVLNGSKRIERDGDSDQVAVYSLQKATRARPRPRLTLQCSYVESGYKPVEGLTLEKRLVPIPIAATSCTLDDSSNELRKHGSCSR